MPRERLTTSFAQSLHGGAIKSGALRLRSGAPLPGPLPAARGEGERRERAERASSVGKLISARLLRGSRSAMKALVFFLEQPSAYFRIAGWNQE